jgi:hypothetical protein
MDRSLVNNVLRVHNQLIDLTLGFNFDYRRAERRVKPVATQPVEQATHVPLPSITTNEKVAPPAPGKNVVIPTPVKPPSPAPPSEEPTTEEAPATVEKSTVSASKASWGKPTAQIWIGQPPENILEMFPPEHREKIKDTRTAFARGSNFPYAVVYFHSVEEATAAIETLTHLRIKFGEEYEPNRSGTYSSRGGSFSQTSYDARKSVGGASDTDNRGGFGRGGRGGRGGSSRGGPSTGSFSSRGSGSGSPAPRGRGRGSNASRDVSTTDNADPATGLWGSGSEERPPVVGVAFPSTSDVNETKSHEVDSPIPAPIPPPSTCTTTTSTAPAAQTSLGAQSSTAGDSQSS